MRIVATSLCRNMSCLLFLSMVILLPSSVTFAKTVSFIKEYSYQASEVDSKVSSRTIALELVKRVLLEELGTYLISETEVKDFDLTKDRISSLTAAFVMTIILEEKWDGKVYFLKAKISADTDELVRSIDKFRKNQEQRMTWEVAAKETEGALNKIDTLKKEMGKGGGEKAIRDKYAQAVNELSAIDWFKKGWTWRYIEHNYQEAMKAFDKAIEIDPNYAKAYALRAMIYNDWNQPYKALRESEKAIKLDPSLSWAFSSRAGAHNGMGNYRESITDCNKAIELNPQNAGAYANRSSAYYSLKSYHQGLEDANKAIEINPNHSYSYFHRGRNLAALGNYQDAVIDYSQSIKLNPIHGRSFLYRGYAFMELGKEDQALGDFKRAASLGNREAQSYLKKKGIQW